MNIAEKLLIGSRRINEMRAGIEQVVSILLGLIRETSQQPPTWESKRIEGSSGYWVVRPEQERRGGGFSSPTDILTVRYFLASSAFSISKGHVYSSANPVQQPHRELVRYLHADLPQFVEGMIKVFPKIKNSVGHFLAIAEL